MVHGKVGALDRDGTTKKTEILKGAMQEFLKHGYAATSMDRVTEAAGVSKATIYSHFKDKEGLFGALVQWMAEEKVKQVFGAEPLQGDPRIVLRQLATTVLKQMACDDEHPQLVRLVIAESGRFPELAQLFIRHQFKPVLERLSRYLADHPELNLPDPEATARFMIGGIVHYMLTQKIMHGQDIVPMDGDRLIDSMMHLVIGCAKF
ncbi:MAG: TetR/AcrR family transcriptional regulator [Leptolyngbyaceae cyanobacterium RU_5_1]|nr:TetR/AcrR family transcriptional regulator [Leptolyngbyaceae cyanobacterium RU_5_1]